MDRRVASERVFKRGCAIILFGKTSFARSRRSRFFNEVSMTKKESLFQAVAGAQRESDREACAVEVARVEHELHPTEETAAKILTQQKRAIAAQERLRAVMRSPHEKWRKKLKRPVPSAS